MEKTKVVKVKAGRTKIIIEKASESKNEFLDFLKNYNVLELAIGVVIAGAVKDLTTSIANDMIMPIIGIISPTGSWREIVFTIAGSEFKIGNMMGSTLNFLIIALLVFVVIKKILRIENSKVKSKK
ncbi:MscL family protein [Candidatus Shapirobacteria bacterium]|nr:MscL family protein [Candidatus Shapirobacteria bacterium]